MMKLLVFAALSALAVVSAYYPDYHDPSAYPLPLGALAYDYSEEGWPYHQYYGGYHGPKHYPIITKEGVPLEPPAVIAARIQHQIAHEVAAHRAYDDDYYHNGGYY